MATATQPQVQRGFPVCCPKCREEGTVLLYAGNTTLFYCTDCGEDIDRDDLDRLFRQVEAWRRLLAWAETAPPLPEGD